MVKKITEFHSKPTDWLKGMKTLISFDKHEYLSFNSNQIEKIHVHRKRPSNVRWGQTSKVPWMTLKVWPHGSSICWS